MIAIIATILKRLKFYRNAKKSAYEKTVIILAVLAFAAGLAWFLFFSDKIAESNIRKEISTANYCETFSDCRIVLSQCPFGCYVVVNKSEVNRIRSIIENYPSRCAYSCVEAKGVDCVSNKCQFLE